MSENILIDEFLNYLRFERHFSPHTAKCYAADLNQFCDFLRSSGGSGSDTGQARTPRVYESPATGFTAAATMTVAPQTQPQADTASNKQLLLAVEGDDVRRFLAFLRDQDYSKSTTARKLATLRSFYKFCIKRSYVDNHPLQEIRTPKQENGCPKSSKNTRCVNFWKPPT